MKKQIKFSMDEVNQIIGQYVIDNSLLGKIEVDSIDVLFHQGNNPDNSYIIVAEG